MTARCERCEKDVEHVWQYAEAADTGWLCQRFLRSQKTLKVFSSSGTRTTSACAMQLRPGPA